jgi:hypothetical protein
MRALAAAAALGALAAAGCGGDDQGATGRAGPSAANLEVVVRAGGPGTPARRSTIQCAGLGPGSAGSPACERLGGLTAAALAPTPATTACAEVFGGPAVASVNGTIQGRRVSARFSLRDACEIKRWRRNRALLGKPPLERP